MKEIPVKKVIEIIKAIIENTEITDDMLDVDLNSIGLNSIAFIRAVVALEEEFECEIPDSMLIFGEMNTINKIVQILSEIESV